LKFELRHDIFLRVKLRIARFNKLSDICSDVALVSLASIVIPFAIDKSNQQMLEWGLVTSFIFWILSMLLVKANP